MVLESEPLLRVEDTEAQIEQVTEKSEQERTEVEENHGVPLAELEQAADTKAFADFLLDIEPGLIEVASKSIIRTGQETGMLPEDSEAAAEIMRNVTKWLDPENKVLRESPLRDSMTVNNLTDIEGTFRQVDAHYLASILDGSLDADTAREKAMAFYRGETDDDEGPEELRQTLQEATEQTPEQLQQEAAAHSTSQYGTDQDVAAHTGGFGIAETAHASVYQAGGPVHQNDRSPIGGAATAHGIQRFERAKPLANQQRTRRGQSSAQEPLRKAA